MNIDLLVNFPTEIIVKIVHHLEFKELAALEQSCQKIQLMISEKQVWKKLCEQYGLFLDGINTKVYLRDHTVSDPERLGNRISKFFSDTLYSTNVFFKCIFKTSGVLDIERIQDTNEKNSLTLLYTSPLDENAKLKINEKVKTLLQLHEILFEETFKKNLRFS